MNLQIPDQEAMHLLGAQIAQLLQAGDLVLLNGQLGAGKTTLTRGIGEGLGAIGTIQSPTFVLARTHKTSKGPKLVHVDAYRLGSADKRNAELHNGRFVGILPDRVSQLFRRGIFDALALWVMAAYGVSLPDRPAIGHAPDQQPQ